MRDVDDLIASKRSTRIGKRAELGLALEQGASEILAHVNGQKTFPTRRVVLPNEADAKQIRK